ncbi:MAG: ROK family protein [Bacteroidales bacterium]|nr:ROK family protein [Candidatus Cryptobacteroides choladohippi]
MIIAIDLGGTKIRAGLINNGNVDKILYELCNAKGSEQDVIDQICTMIDSLMNPEVKAIGIGVPSVVDAEKGIIYDVVAIPSWKEVHLKEILEAKYGLPVSVDNDCNCFAIGVARYGEAKPFTNSVCVTLGTGVGSGIIIDHKLYRGSNTGAGEIGSIPYLDRDYEYYCSSRFFEGKGTSGKEAAEAAAKGDEKALAIWKEFGMHVGKLLEMILFAFDTDAVVIGGSIANAFDLFKDAMLSELQNFPYGKALEKFKVMPSSMEYVGLFGAAAICED